MSSGEPKGFRTAKGNVTAKGRADHGEKDGSFPIASKRSAEAALKLRGHASSPQERSSIISRAAKYAPEAAKAARKADKAAGKLSESTESQDLAGTPAGQLPNCPSWPSPDIPYPQAKEKKTMAKKSSKKGGFDVMKEHPHQKATDKSEVKMADPAAEKAKKAKAKSKAKGGMKNDAEDKEECSDVFQPELYSENYLGSEEIVY
jgi:hypothetical protein